MCAVPLAYALQKTAKKLYAGFCASIIFGSFIHVMMNPYCAK